MIDIYTDIPIDQYTRAGIPCPRCGGQVLQGYAERSCLQCGFSVGGDDWAGIGNALIYNPSRLIIKQANNYSNRRRMARRQ